MCWEIEKKTGIRATSSVLALNRLLRVCGIRKLGLVTPYTWDVQAAIVRNYEEIGVGIGGGMERYLSVVRNTDIAEIGEEVLDGLVEEVVKGGAQAVTTFCTNLVAAQKVRIWEERYRMPVFDTVTTVVWDMLRVCGVDVSALEEDWGMMYGRGGPE